MRAVVCKQFGPPESLTVEELPSPEPGAGQVRVKVEAAGLNFPDTLIIEGKYQFKPPFPFTPGGEVAGAVDAVGDGVTKVKKGDRVLAFLGVGGFAEEVLAGEDQVFPVPPSMPTDFASGFVLAYATSHHALKDRARMQPGETLLVLGAAGGVGLAAVEIGKAMGARVIAAASTDEKLDVCKRHGADAVINYAKEDLRERVKALTNGLGADVIYDPVGGSFAEPALRSIAWDGRYLVVGFAAGDIPKVALNWVLIKQCHIVGVFWGAFINREPAKHAANMTELFAMFEAGKIRPAVSARYPFARVADALNDMRNRKITGKAVLVP